MSLRAVKRRFTAKNALTVAVATTSMTYELADIFQFPPARAATGILLLIFQTIEVGTGLSCRTGTTLIVRTGYPDKQRPVLPLGQTMSEAVDRSSRFDGRPVGGRTRVIAQVYHQV